MISPRECKCELDFLAECGEVATTRSKVYRDKSAGDVAVKMLAGRVEFGDGSEVLRSQSQLNLTCAVDPGQVQQLIFPTKRPDPVNPS